MSQCLRRLVLASSSWCYSGKFVGESAHVRWTMPFVRENALILFSERDLADLVREQIERAHIEVAAKDADELLSMPVEDQLDIIVAHFQLILPILREDLA